MDEELIKKTEKTPRNGLIELSWMAAIATSIKVLLIPAYHSTDFEVHRHWLALTHSLPVRQWYLDETSPWTLDYPPLFAWFERFLAIFGSLVDPKMVDLVNGLNYKEETVVVFQRATVMVADLLLYWALWRCCRKLPLEKQRLVYIAVVCSPGLFIVDHIHFQYNGFLLGILLLSLSLLNEGQDLMGGVVFAVLLCFKHLFAVAGPVYFVYLLRHYCRGSYKILRFFTLGVSVVIVFLLAFGPFLYYGQIPQVLSRLFPFVRGLCHAYWAPNLWALYNTTDKVIAFSLRKLGFNFQTPTASLTGGLVGDFTPYAVLPQVTPMGTLVLVMLAMFPCLVQIWRHPQQQHVVRWVAYAYACGFMFGWHVHEKASLHFVIPLSLVAISNLEDAGHYILLSIVSCYSMFPLLYEDKEYTVKVLLLTIQGAILWSSFSLCLSNKNPREQLACDHSSSTKPASQSCLPAIFCAKGNMKRTTLIEKVGQVYLWGLIIIEIWGSFLHPYFFNDKLPFLPLMLGSVYCALGMVYSWGFQLYCILFWT
eukprot:Gb_35161 [translate_table: standard]